MTPHLLLLTTLALCSDSPENHQLDFWIGEWDVQTAAGQPAGRSVIQPILGHCTILETWTGRDGFTGQSFNVLDPQSRQWEQTWVDSSGARRKLSGEVRNGAMHYVARDLDAQKRPMLVRMILSSPDASHVRQLSELSRDNGKTWLPRYDFLYTRRTPAADALRALVDRYARSWREGQADGVMACFWDDAVILPHHGDPPRVGAAALRQFWFPADARPTAVTALRLEPAEVVAEGRFGYARGAFWLTYEAGGRPVSNAGTFLMIFRRNDAGEWRISRYMWDERRSARWVRRMFAVPEAQGLIDGGEGFAMGAQGFKDEVAEAFEGDFALL